MIFENTSISFSVYRISQGLIGVSLHTHHREPSKPTEARPEWMDQVLYDLAQGVFPFSEEKFPYSAGIVKALRQICSAGAIVPGIAKDHGFTGYAYGHGITFHVKFTEVVTAEKKTHMALANAEDHYLMR